jgi:asparagine synthetase B (glutamine-hydrolysing)
MRKAQRLHNVQKSLQRLEEDRISVLQSRQAELASLQEEIVGALNTDEAVQDLLVSAIVRRLKSLNEESMRLAAELERRYQALRTIAPRTKCAERLSNTYEQQHERALAEKELRDIIERIAHSEYASLP